MKRSPFLCSLFVLPVCFLAASANAEPKSRPRQQPLVFKAQVTPSAEMPVGRGESFITVEFANELGVQFDLRRIELLVDGKSVYLNTSTSESIDLRGPLTLYMSYVQPGPHKLKVALDVGGNGFGVFPYHRAYKVKIGSSFMFDGLDGQRTTIRITPETDMLEREIQRSFSVNYAMYNR